MIVECIDDRKYSFFKIGEMYICEKETDTCYIINLKENGIDPKIKMYNRKTVKVSKKCFVKITK